MFMNILSGKGTAAQNAVVAANAALALLMTNAYADYATALDAANESLSGGKALQVLHKLIAIQS
jgi:anthranilate phosphoribosyltransferase